MYVCLSPLLRDKITDLIFTNYRMSSIMRSFAKVDYLKTNGCAANLINELEVIPHITNVKVNIEEQLVSFQCSNEKGRFIATQTLREFNCKELMADC